ncbi:hypothetical protein BZG36_02469 [Bifiguratus adelaidae]|uniref:Cytochrome P450 n=1 Tax=Bifiguratus adelaidae TaxID=1938954 RepID=A0A261Y0V8_9FUNG|nr:hypothetical protein BZG36_02469 [Bifiguratus adelaidae]
MEGVKFSLARLNARNLQVWLRNFVQQVRERKGFVLLLLGYLVVYRLYSAIVTVPSSLKHLKATNRIKDYQYMLQGKPADVRKRLSALPVLRQTGSGVFLSGDRGVWTVAVAEPKAARTLLMKTSIFPKTIFANRPRGDIIEKWLGKDNIVNSNGDTWKKHRKPANPAFHKAMPINLFGRLTKTFFKQVELENNRVHVNKIMQRFTLDAIGNGAFDFDFQALEKPDSKEIRAYNNVMHIIFDPLNFVIPWLDAFLSKVSRARRDVHDQVDLLNDVLAKMIAKKKQSMKEGNGAGIADEDKDLLTMMLVANHEEVDGSKRLTDAQLRSDLAIFFVAGHDTTSNALTFALYHLAVNPGVQHKAREECIRVLGDTPQDIVPTAEQIKELTYTSQIIQETLRLNPPAQGTSQRLVAEDTELGGYFIPKGSMAALDIWSLHHNPNVWDDPETWNPDRFAPGGEYESKDSYSWLPFGHGQRQCIGMQFSLAEQRVFLSMLLRKYEISLPADSIHAKGLVITPQFGVLSADNLIVDLKPRY